MTKSCSNCKYRMWKSWSGYDYCMTYEMTADEQECIEAASDCPRYTPEEETAEERYTKSSTAGDYSPSCPWKAEGMSINDFI